MARVKFSKDFNYTPKEDRRVSILYNGCSTYTVRRDAADAAIAVGAGKEVTVPSRKAGDAKSG